MIPVFSECLWSFFFRKRHKAMPSNFNMVANTDPLAAALAAAAELAQNGGAYMYSPQTTNEIVFPIAIPQSPVTETMHEDDENDDDEDAEKRMERNRERNREHARRTRLRKKAQLEALTSKVKGLQAESKVLKQSLEECSIASILVGLASGEHDVMMQSLVEEVSEVDEADVLRLIGGKRKRFVSDASDRIPQPLKINIDGQNTFIGGGRSHINWKTGVYSDENGNHRQLSQADLDSLRRERNRMHAKMTRDRKKNFISTIEKTIEKLESTNKKMKHVLTSVIQTHFKSHTSVPGVTTVSPPLESRSSSPENVVPHLSLDEVFPSPPIKKARLELA